MNTKNTHGGARVGAGRKATGRKATCYIQIRVTPERKAQIEQSAKKAGMSISEYLLHDK